jgi:hypothetical protein
MSQLRVNSIGNLDGSKIDSTSDIVDVGLRNDVAYAQFNKIAAQSFGGSFTTIALDQTAMSKNIQLSGNEIQFLIPGVYKIDVGLRFGTSSDSWTGCRLYNATTGIVGISYGTGNITNDAGPATFNFLANVANIGVNYALQIYRAGGNWSQATPDVNAGIAIAATIVKVS